MYIHTYVCVQTYRCSSSTRNLFKSKEARQQQQKVLVVTSTHTNILTTTIAYYLYFENDKHVFV